MKKFFINGHIISGSFKRDKSTILAFHINKFFKLNPGWKLVAAGDDLLFNQLNRKILVNTDNEFIRTYENARIINFYKIKSLLNSITGSYQHPTLLVIDDIIQLFSLSHLKNTFAQTVIQLNKTKKAPFYLFLTTPKIQLLDLYFGAEFVSHFTNYSALVSVGYEPFFERFGIDVKTIEPGEVQNLGMVSPRLGHMILPKYQFTKDNPDTVKPVNSATDKYFQQTQGILQFSK